jgi:hypothetical protein
LVGSFLRPRLVSKASRYLWRVYIRAAQNALQLRIVRRCVSGCARSDDRASFRQLCF